MRERRPRASAGLASVRSDPFAFGSALGTLTHEAAHARGIRSEACAELWAVTTPTHFLEAFYNVRLGDPFSLKVVQRIVDESRGDSTACWAADLGP